MMEREKSRPRTARVAAAAAAAALLRVRRPPPPLRWAGEGTGTMPASCSWRRISPWDRLWGVGVVLLLLLLEEEEEIESVVVACGLCEETPLTLTVTVSTLPAPLGPSMTRVLSVRRSPTKPALFAFAVVALPDSPPGLPLPFCGDLILGIPQPRDLRQFCATNEVHIPHFSILARALIGAIQ